MSFLWEEFVLWCLWRWILPDKAGGNQGKFRRKNPQEDVNPVVQLFKLLSVNLLKPTKLLCMLDILVSIKILKRVVCQSQSQQSQRRQTSKFNFPLLSALQCGCWTWKSACYVERDSPPWDLHGSVCTGHFCCHCFSGPGFSSVSVQMSLGKPMLSKKFLVSSHVSVLKVEQQEVETRIWPEGIQNSWQSRCFTATFPSSCSPFCRYCWVIFAKPSRSFKIAIMRVIQLGHRGLVGSWGLLGLVAGSEITADSVFTVSWLFHWWSSNRSRWSRSVRLFVCTIALDEEWCYEARNLSTRLGSVSGGLGVNFFKS